MTDPGVLIAIQKLSTPFLDTFFYAVTQLGHEYAYVAILLFVYWCVDRRIGHRTAILFLFSMWLNGWVKELVASPRPSPAQGVRVLVWEESFAFPSGHAQGGATLWGYLAWALGSRPFWGVAAALIVLIGFSRLYLGAHFLGDVLGGYALAFALVVVAAALERWGVIAVLPRGLRFVFAVAAPLALYPLYQSDASVQTLGLLLGVAASGVFALELLPYDPRGGVLRQAAKMVLGLAGMGGLYLLHRHLPEGFPEFLGYAVMAVWVTVLAPWLFIRLGLARASEPSARRRSGRWWSPYSPVRPGWGPVYGSPSLAGPLRGLLMAAAAISVALGVLALTHTPPSARYVPILAELGRHDILVIGHRGAAGLAPENTLVAIERGLLEGAQVIEVDVHRTRDGHLVLMHDPTVDRTTGGSGYVRDMTLAEIKTLDAGYWFTPDGVTYPYRGRGVTVPTLEEALTAFPAARFLIEIKEPDPEAADAVAAVIRRTGAQGRVIMGTFHDAVAARFREVMPEVPTTASQGEAIRFVILARLGLDTVFSPSPPWDILSVPPDYGWITVITQGLVGAASRMERPVYVFTVNDPALARRLIALGVHGIVTDRPDLISGM